MRKKKKEEERPPKIRIKLKGYDAKLVDASARQIVEIGERYGVEISGPVPLPTEIHKYTVNRSPFVHKNAREQFEIRIHKRLIDFKKITPRLVEALQTVNLPSGVEIEIKLK
jgi:small subunit ribosomal protein S10